MSDPQKNGDDSKTGVRPISRGYVTSFAFALVGIVMIAVAVGGELEARAGRNPIGANDRYGVPAMLFIWFLGYLVRFIFWRRISAPRQNQVRIVITGIMIVEVLAAIVASVLILGGPARPTGGDGISLFFGALCQVATVMWLVRYRRE